MNNAMIVFRSLIEQCSTTMVVYEYLESKCVPLDAFDLLRWQYVLAVSALDKYIHDIVRIGMIQIFQGNRSETAKYKSFRIEFSLATIINNSANPEIVFSNEITRQHSFLAFQDPDKIADALSYIWEAKHKWSIISSNMATPISETDLKTKLKNIVIRRNQIVHEGDCLSTQIPLQQQIITKADTQDVINFIKELVVAIGNSI